MSLEKHYSIQFGQQELSFNIGEIARQAHGSVVISYGGTVLLCAVTVGNETEEERNFLPLTVNYVEKFYSVGKVPGGYLKREGRPATEEILTARAIDRSLRPLFKDGFCRDVQVSCTLLSYEKGCDHEVAALIGCSLACRLAGLPMSDTIACCRVGYMDDSYILNPSSDLEENKLNLFVSSTKSSILMVESEADQLSEDTMIGALKFAQDNVQDVLSLMDNIIKKHGKQEIEFIPLDYSDLYNEVYDSFSKDFKKVYQITDRKKRDSGLKELRKKIKEDFLSDDVSENAINTVCSKMEKFIVRESMFASQKRIDGRSFEEIRSLDAKIDVLPKKIVHGSALFTRGETQALVVTTLGSESDEQMINVPTVGNKKESFMLHYNFPPYSVGEAIPQRPTSRREIGHGNLAHRALKSVLPSKDSFPYTIRIVSEITESNGSSSMATVCGATLSLLSTGIPLTAPVSGIAMGLIKEKDEVIILTDIMGDEDHLGDMDFKVAKTELGVTALQMDIKINGVNLDIMSKAINQASKACSKILDVIKDATSGPIELSVAVPKIEEIKIPVKKISELIGKSGSNIKAICEETESKIDIEQDGSVRIFAPDSERIEMAKQMINDSIAEIEVGSIYYGIVSKIMPFGALVSLPGNKSGMVRISEIADKHIDDIREYLQEGEEVKVKVLGFDERRRIKLSIKKVD